MRKWVMTIQNVGYDDFMGIFDFDPEEKKEGKIQIGEEDDLYILGDICSLENVSDMDRFIRFFDEYHEKAKAEKNRKKDNIHYMIGLTDYYVIQASMCTDAEREKRITYENVLKRIQPEMTMDEFEKILGAKGLGFLQKCPYEKIINIEGIPHYLSYGSPLLKSSKENQIGTYPRDKLEEQTLEGIPDMEGPYYIKIENGLTEDAVVYPDYVGILETYKEDRINAVIVSARHPGFSPAAGKRKKESEPESSGNEGRESRKNGRPDRESMRPLRTARPSSGTSKEEAQKALRERRKNKAEKRPVTENVIEEKKEAYNIEEKPAEKIQEGITGTDSNHGKNKGNDDLPESKNKNLRKIIDTGHVLCIGTGGLLDDGQSCLSVVDLESQEIQVVVP